MSHKGPKSSTHVRFPEAFERRLQAYAKEHRITLSAAIRIAAQRGLADMEREASQSAPAAPPPPAPARRVLSRGIGG